MNDRVFVDSNVWLYAFVLRPGEEAKHARALPFVEAVNRYTISTQVVAEVSVNLLKKANMPESDLLSVVEGPYRRCEVTETGLECHRRASRFRASHSFSYWDSLILAAAVEAGCTTLYSEDMQHGQVVDGSLTILNPLIDP